MTGVTTRDGRVTGVVTDRGAVEAEVVVNCAGQWAKAVGLLCGVDVPLHSAEHFYVVTEAMEGVHPHLPILRDPDGYTYVKEEVGGLVVGGFEPTAKPWVAPDALPYPFEFQLLEEDWDHFSILMESAVHRIPALAAHRAEEAVQRPGELHARQPVHPGRGARTPGASSSGRGSTRSGSRRAAAPGGPSPSGSSRASRPATSWPSTSGASPRSTPTTGGCGTGWARCSASTTRCPGPTGSWRRPVRSAGRPSITCWPARGPSSARRWGGSGPTSSPRPAGPPSSTTPGTGPSGSPGRPPSRRPPGSAWPSSTRRPSASSSWSVGTPRRCSSACARRTWPSSRAGPSTRACSTSGPGTRPT